MAKRDKIDMSMLNDKEILLAYCNTLGEARCRTAYKMLREEFDCDRTKTIRFNGYGIRDDHGSIRLTTNQFNKMMAECGDYKFKWLVGCLHDYIDYLKGLADIGDARAKRNYKLYTTGSSYPKLVKGWVIEKYNREATPPPETVGAGTIDFYSIRTEAEALAYVDSMPIGMLEDSPELDFLVNKFSKVAEKVRDMNGTR